MEAYKCSKILRMLDGERTGEVFCSPNISVPTWDVMDAIHVHFPDAHMHTDQIVKLAESSYTLLGFDSIRSSSDIGVEAHALGAEVNMGGRESFVYVTKPAFDDPEAFDIHPNLLELGRFPINFEAVSILKGKYKEIVPIYALLMGPITLMGFLFGVEKTMRWTLKEPTLFQNLLERVSDVVIHYGNRLTGSGADALSLADPTASPNVISPRIFKKFVLPIYQKLSEKIENRIILHTCGDTTPILGFILESGFCAFSFEGPAVEVKTAKKILGNRMALFGNIPTVDILMNGGVDDVKRNVKKACEDGIDSIAPACSFPLQTPIANQRAMVEAVREYNKSRC